MPWPAAGGVPWPTAIGIPWPADQIPAPGHYCFVATVGNTYQSAPNPALLNNFASFADYENYIATTNQITWRNFNVVTVPMGKIRPPWGHLIPLPFHLTGAWNTGTGSGPFTMTACSTDRNQQNGFYCNATGTAPVRLTF